MSFLDQLPSDTYYSEFSFFVLVPFIKSAANTPSKLALVSNSSLASKAPTSEDKTEATLEEEADKEESLADPVKNEATEIKSEVKLEPAVACEIKTESEQEPTNEKQQEAEEMEQDTNDTSEHQESTNPDSKPDTAECKDAEHGESNENRQQENSAEVTQPDTKMDDTDMTTLKVDGVC